MNLINDPWIPVKRADGRRETIAPWQLTEGMEGNPIVALASPRPDFDGALIQFLIGLLQTTCAPSEEGWWDWREAPPSMEVLRERFSTVAHAFELEGEVAFMQDFASDELTTQSEISALLIEAPGEKTQEENKDHFVKRGIVWQICPACAATALLTMQTNAPSGGKGYRTSLRGWGPLTTVVVGRNLWETCWLNVLELRQYIGGFETNNGDSRRFPWLAPTRVSEARPPAGMTTPVDVHPDQQFWGLPRRIRLQGSDTASPALCDLCGASVSKVFRRFTTRNYGVNYQGFEHPLSPHRTKEELPDCLHPDADGIGYRNWLGLVVSAASDTRRPARVVERFRSQVREDGCIWAFGFDMDNMKARCWYDATMPLLTVPEGKDSIFKASVERLILSADWVASVARGRIKDAMLRKAEARGDLSFATSHFWTITEAPFYNLARKLRDGLAVDQDETSLMEDWLSELRRAALGVFDHYAQAGDFDAVNPRQVATARNNLGKSLSGNKLRELLGLSRRTRVAS